MLLPFAAAKPLQSCPTLCDPIDGSPPGSPVPGILQARTLEWVAISFSNAWKWKLKAFITRLLYSYVSPYSMNWFSINIKDSILFLEQVNKEANKWSYMLDRDKKCLDRLIIFPVKECKWKKMESGANSSWFSVISDNLGGSLYLVYGKQITWGFFTHLYIDALLLSKDLSSINSAWTVRIQGNYTEKTPIFMANVSTFMLLKISNSRFCLKTNIHEGFMIARSLYYCLENH